jgi:hypothetical protein
MSISLPENTSLQLGDNSGNISHQGVLGSNLNQTTTLSSTFPTTSTGDSLGHYHYTDVSTNALKFLNCSGNGTGGHEFWTSNSSTTPFKTATLDASGFTIEKSTQGEPFLLPLPNIINSIDIVVSTETPINIAPYNMTPITSIFPVQVNSNCTNMSTGITYYAKVFGTNSLQLNTSPDGGVPTIINTSDLASRPQPILSLINGYQTLIKTSNLNENLTIIDVSNVSILSSTDLTFNSISLQETLSNLQIKQISSINQYISAAIYADGRPPTAPTVTITQQYAFTPAWYFKNTVAGYKINWYIGPDISMNVSQVLGLYMSIFNGLTTSNDNTPFIVCYTQPQVGDLTFYHSKRVFIFNQSIQPIANTRYFMFKNVSSTCPTPFHYGSTLINLETSNVVGSNVGPFAPTEQILAFAIGTNSTSTVNSVEFAVSKFGIMTPTGTQEILFIPST